MSNRSARPRPAVKATPVSPDPERIELDADLTASIAQAQSANAQMQRDLAMFLKGRGTKAPYALSIEGGVAVLVKQSAPETPA